MPEAATERRRRTCGCLGQTCLLVLCLLMTWFYIRCVFCEIELENIQTLREKVINGAKKVKTGVLMMAESSGKEEVEKQSNINRVLSSLLDVAASVKNENQLETFQFYLQELADKVKTVKLNEQQIVLMEWVEPEGGDNKLAYQHSRPVVSVLHLRDSSPSTTSSAMASSGSFGSTKALLLMVTLLSLVCAGQGLIDNADLTKMMENIQELQKEAARRKAVIKLENLYVGIAQKLLLILDYLTEKVINVLQDQHVLDILEESKDILVDTISDLQQNLRYEATIISDNERKLRLLMEMIINLYY
ncbi:hypothetical protein OJAV_G00183260 [Oryzias javanicus]|uniref:Uncharacterized protein n=1 Tax=Oryzias javanicus TaxID=123683 RepID=A0A437CCZ9_ORYJA|nr:hypothetical protein OJAV_G00183260 [Oryzias javanicus]